MAVSYMGFGLLFGTRCKAKDTRLICCEIKFWKSYVKRVKDIRGIYVPKFNFVCMYDQSLNTVTWRARLLEIGFCLTIFFHISHWIFRFNVSCIYIPDIYRYLLNCFLGWGTGAESLNIITFKYGGMYESTVLIYK